MYYNLIIASTGKIDREKMQKSDEQQNLKRVQVPLNLDKPLHARIWDALEEGLTKDQAYALTARQLMDDGLKWRALQEEGDSNA